MKIFFDYGDFLPWNERFLEKNKFIIHPSLVFRWIATRQFTLLYIAQDILKTNTCSTKLPKRYINWIKYCYPNPESEGKPRGDRLPPYPQKCHLRGVKLNSGAKTTMFHVVLFVLCHAEGQKRDGRLRLLTLITTVSLNSYTKLTSL